MHALLRTNLNTSPHTGLRARLGARLGAGFGAGFGAVLPLLLGLGTAACGAEQPQSVVVITFDTTRADRIGCYGKANAGTPAWDALAARGVRFAAAHTTAPITLPAHASLMSGVLPIHSGVRDNGFFQLPDDEVTLAELLRSKGLRTAAFVSAFPVYRQFGLDQGFEVYDHLQPRDAANPFAEDERPGAQTTEAAIRWLDGLGRSEPVFLWLHLFDPHLPYLAPEPYAQRYPDDPYQAEIAYADACAGQLLDALEASGRLEHTLVFAIGDHGEAFGEHDEFGHGSLIQAATMRVPMVVAGPGVPRGTVVERDVSVVDVLPTVSEMFRLPRAPLARGVSLSEAWGAGAASAEAGRAVFLETVHPRINYGWSDLAGVVRDRWKYVEAPRSDQPGELFDLNRDPEELVDLASEEPELAAELAELLRALRATAKDEGEAARAPSAEELASLARLGYLDGGAPATDAERTLPHPSSKLAVYADVTRARVMLSQGDAARALEYIEQAQAADPDGYVVQEVLGEYWSAIAGGDPALLQRSAEHFARAVEKNGANPVPWINLARCHTDLGQYVEALDVLRVARERSLASGILDQEQERVLQTAKLLANELEQTGDTAGAVALWEALARSRPNDAGPSQRLEHLRRQD